MRSVRTVDSARRVAEGLGVQRSTWLQALLLSGMQHNQIDRDRYAELTANLIGGGQSYLGANSIALADALALDIKTDPTKPGPLFRALVTILGGKIGEMRSHIGVALQFLDIIWKDERYRDVRKPATGLMLESLLRERTSDYRNIMTTIVRLCPDIDGLLEYIKDWAIGHFMAYPKRVVMPPSATRQQRRKSRRRR